MGGIRSEKGGGRDQEISKYVCFRVIVLFNENLNIIPKTGSSPDGNSPIISLEVVQVPFPVCTNDELGHVYCSSISSKTATVFNEKKKRSSTTTSLQDSTI